MIIYILTDILFLVINNWTQGSVLCTCPTLNSMPSLSQGHYIHQKCRKLTYSLLGRLLFRWIDHNFLCFLQMLAGRELSSLTQTASVYYLLLWLGRLDFDFITNTWKLLPTELIRRHWFFSLDNELQTVFGNTVENLSIFGAPYL